MAALSNPVGVKKVRPALRLIYHPASAGVDFLTLMMDEEEGIPIRRIEK
ncbi:MAG: hypothetical protein WBP80_06160 [Planifilum fulgidum]|jgi:hypothetical protein